MSRWQVTGAPRSGKSLVARILALAGVRVGPSDRLVTHLCEHPELVKISDEVLARRGACWYRPPAVAGDAATEQDLVRRARRIVARDLSTASVWAWKDPRIGIVLDFWQRVAPGLRTICCVRNPAAVARDLQRRDDLPLEAGLALWADYTRGVLSASDRLPTQVVVYEDVLADPDGATIGLAGSPASLRRR